MKISEISIKRPSIIIVLFIILTLGGLFSYKQLSYELIPKFEVNVLTVSTIYPGASPSEVENTVSKVIEDAVSSLENVKKIEAKSFESLSLVIITLTNEADVNYSLNDAQRKINAILKDLPEDIDPPSLNKFSLDDMPIMTLSVTSKLTEKELYDLLDKKIQPTFSRINGKIVRVLVKEGDYVRVGQTLAIVQGDKLNVNLQNAQAVYNNAEADLKRFESAFATGGVTKQQLDQSKLQLENAKNSLQSAKLNTSDANIKATINGVVNSKKIEPGTYVSPGTPLFDIVNVSTLKLRVNVDEKNVALLKLGQRIEVTASVYGDKKFSGNITFIAPKADETLNFPVDIEIKNNVNNELRAGMYGTAIFGADKSENLLVVSRAAFVGSVSSNQIFINENGVAKLKNVTSGRNFGDYVEILQGLKEGDLAIISGQINLLDNTAVSVIK